MTRVPAMRTLENALRRVGFVHVAGVDEVGRGCLAGPVVAAAVVLHPGRHIPGVCDSKIVPAIERERLYDRILRHAVAWAVAAADPAEIDRINIHQASLRAMQRAVLSLVAAAGHRARGRVPRARAADGAARCPARRPPLLGHCRGVDHREGDARSRDAASCTVAIRATGSIATRAMRRRIISRPLHGSATQKSHRRSFRPPTLFDTID